MTRVWSNGISVDPGELDEIAMTPEFSRYRYLLRAAPGQRMIMRVDRLDLTKNVVRGFEAYERLLEDHPELQRARDVPGAAGADEVGHPDVLSATRKRRWPRLTSINRRFGNLHWKPVRIMFEHNRVQALAAMSLYDVHAGQPRGGRHEPGRQGRAGAQHAQRRARALDAAGAYADLDAAPLASTRRTSSRRRRRCTRR